MKERRKRVSKVLQGICKEENLGRNILIGPVFLYVLINCVKFCSDLWLGFAVDFYVQRMGYAIAVMATMSCYAFGRTVSKKFSDKNRTMRKGLVDSREVVGMLPISKKEMVFENVRWWTIVNLAVCIQIAIVQIEGILFGMEIKEPMGCIFFPLATICMQIINFISMLKNTRVLCWFSTIASVLFYIACFFPFGILSGPNEMQKYELQTGNIQVENVVTAVAILLLGIGYQVALPYFCKGMKNSQFV